MVRTTFSVVLLVLVVAVVAICGKSAKGVLVNITGGADMTLHEVGEASRRITAEVEDDTANIIFGSAYDSTLEGKIRVSVVATGDVSL